MKIHPWTTRFLLVVQPVLLLAFGDFAARLYDGVSKGEVGVMLRLGHMLEYVIASAVIAYSFALLMNYLEYRYTDNQSSSDGA